VQFIAFAIAWLRVHIRSEKGQDLLEYALLGGLIAAALLAAGIMITISGGVELFVGNIRDCIDFEPSPCDISLP
jgi:Flp pilus assembly pilin Flp